MKISYTGLSYLTGILTFIAVWIYAIAQWGFLLGIAFGWLPAIISAFLAGLLWPLALVLLIIGAVMLLAAIFFTSNFMESETFMNIIYILGFVAILYAIAESIKQFKQNTLPKIKSQGILKTVKESETYKKEKPATWIALVVVILIWGGILLAVTLFE